MNRLPFHLLIGLATLVGTSPAGAQSAFWHGPWFDDASLKLHSRGLWRGEIRGPGPWLETRLQFELAGSEDATPPASDIRLDLALWSPLTDREDQPIGDDLSAEVLWRYRSNPAGKVPGASIAVGSRYAHSLSQPSLDDAREAIVDARYTRRFAPLPEGDWTIGATAAHDFSRLESTHVRALATTSITTINKFQLCGQPVGITIPLSADWSDYPYPEDAEPRFGFRAANIGINARAYCGDFIMVADTGLRAGSGGNGGTLGWISFGFTVDL